MPSRIRDLIEDYFDKQHPLARGIEPQELPVLIYRVQRLFQSRNTILHSSAGALWCIRETAAQCAQNAVPSARPFTDEDHLSIVRGLTAYIGRVMCKAADGMWVSGKCLLDVGFIEAGNTVMQRGSERKTVTRIFLCAGCFAADIWEAALSGNSNPIDIPIWTYGVWPDGHADWQEARMLAAIDDDEPDGPPAAWRISE